MAHKVVRVVVLAPEGRHREVRKTVWRALCTAAGPKAEVRQVAVKPRAYEAALAPGELLRLRQEIEGLPVRIEAVGLRARAV